jgi:hypothetical protein
LEPGVNGRIDRSLLLKAGYEFADFEQTIAPGSKLDVEVIGRRENRQFVKLDLQRNRA